MPRRRRPGPKVVRNAFQRLYDLITSFGMKESSDRKETLRNFTFFSDPLGEDATQSSVSPAR